MATKNHFDVIIENNKKLNGDLADVTGEIYFNVSSAAAENAMTESEYLAATEGTRHDVYEANAQKELSGQVSDAYKQVSTAYDLSKPTYGTSGKKLYGAGMQNSGYAQYAANANAESFRASTAAIESGRESALSEIKYNTEVLKRQNQKAYAEYLSKYGTVLDDYNRYLEKDEYTDAQIVAKLKKDGYTDDQIAAVPQLQSERDWTEKQSQENYTFDRDALIADLDAGNVSPEFATIKLLENYGVGDAAKMAEDISAGRITQEAGEAWVDTVIDAYTEGGARVPYTYIDAWEQNGLLTPEEALDYKHTVNKERADAAVTAFDSAENVDQFLSLFGEGYDAPDSVKYGRALELLVSLDNTGVLTGTDYENALKNAVDGYSKAVDEADAETSTNMLAAANAIYEDAKANGAPNLETLKKAVGKMYAKVSIDEVVERLSADAADGVKTLANYAAAVFYGNAGAGGEDVRSVQEAYLKKFATQNKIKVYQEKISETGRDETFGFSTKKVATVYYVEVNGTRVEIGRNYDVGSVRKDFTREQIAALEQLCGKIEELK